MSQIELYVEGPTQENVHPPYVDNLIRGLVEHLAGHGQQITDAGDRRCWRQSVELRQISGSHAVLIQPEPDQPTRNVTESNSSISIHQSFSLDSTTYWLVGCRIDFTEYWHGTSIHYDNGTWWWLENGPVSDDSVTVTSFISAFLLHCRAHYRSPGIIQINQSCSWWRAVCQFKETYRRRGKVSKPYIPAHT